MAYKTLISWLTISRRLGSKSHSVSSRVLQSTCVWTARRCAHNWTRPGRLKEAAWSKSRTALSKTRTASLSLHSRFRTACMPSWLKWIRKEKQKNKIWTEEQLSGRNSKTDKLCYNRKTSIDTLSNPSLKMKTSKLFLIIRVMKAQKVTRTSLKSQWLGSGQGQAQYWTQRWNSWGYIHKFRPKGVIDRALCILPRHQKREQTNQTIQRQSWKMPATLT